MPPKRAGKKESSEEEGLQESSGLLESHGAGENVQQQANEPILQAIELLRSDFSTMKSDICSTIDTKLREVTDSLRGEIANLETHVNARIDVLKATVDGHHATLEHVERATSANSDSIPTLQVQVKALAAEVAELSEKCLDLEGRSKRQNLRIVGVQERLEHGRNVRDFVAELLKEVLELEEPPLLDRAHRALRVQPEDGRPPRHLILRVHYDHVLEKIMRKVTAKRSLRFNNQPIYIFRDFPPAVVKRRAAFTKVRQMLKDKPGVKFGLLYPAKLRVTYNGNEKVFTDPTEALKFVQEHFGAEKGP